MCMECVTITNLEYVSIINRVIQIQFIAIIPLPYTCIPTFSSYFGVSIQTHVNNIHILMFMHQHLLTSLLHRLIQVESGSTQIERLHGCLLLLPYPSYVIHVHAHMQTCTGNYYTMVYMCTSTQWLYPTCCCLF